MDPFVVGVLVPAALLAVAGVVRAARESLRSEVMLEMSELTSTRQHGTSRKCSVLLPRAGDLGPF